MGTASLPRKKINKERRRPSLLINQRNVNADDNSQHKCACRRHFEIAEFRDSQI